MTPGMREQIRQAVDREKRLRNIEAGGGNVDIAAPADLEPVIARLAACVSPDSTIDVAAHVAAVARVVVAAKRRPRNPYAAATL